MKTVALKDVTVFFIHPKKPNFVQNRKMTQSPLWEGKLIKHQCSIEKT